MTLKVNGKVLNFEVIDQIGEDTDYVRCKENGAYAFVTKKDGYNLFSWEREFPWEREVIYVEEVKSVRLPYGYRMWGGELRDDLPHGARYYLNGGRR